MKLTSSGLTHVGMKRSHNEDCLRIFREEGLFVVADGMGGHSSGEVASELSAETLARFYAHTALDEEITWPGKEDYATTYQENRIRVGVQLSNRKIHEAAVYDVKLKGMGTTLVAAAFYEDKYSVGHVGDSRVYHFRDGALRQVTEDHSLLNDYIKMRPGGMTPEEIKAFPHKNVIVRALGMKDSVVVDVITEQARAGDLLLLCSDGLSGMITDEEMQELILEAIAKGGGSPLSVDLDALCVSLINAANRNGGNDNVTVLIVRCDDMSGEGVELSAPKMQQPKGSPLWSRAADRAPPPAVIAPLEVHNPTPPTPTPEQAPVTLTAPAAPAAPALAQRPLLQPLSARLAAQGSGKPQPTPPVASPQDLVALKAKSAEQPNALTGESQADPSSEQGAPIERGRRPLPSLSALEGAGADESGDPTMNMSPPLSQAGLEGSEGALGLAGRVAQREVADQTVDMSAEGDETVDLDASLSDGVGVDEFEEGERTSADPEQLRAGGAEYGGGEAEGER